MENRNAKISFGDWKFSEDKYIEPNQNFTGSYKEISVIYFAKTLFIEHFGESVVCKLP